MKKNEIYRFCLKAGYFDETPVFKIKVGKFEKTINTYYIPADKQRYNYDILIERNKQPEIMVEVFANEKMLGQGVLKFDAEKADLPNEVIEIMDNKKKIGSLQCSLKKIDKKTKKPPLKIKIISGSYLQDLDTVGKMDPFIVVKYADNNYKTKVCEGGGKTPSWNEQFNIGTSQNDRIFLQSWEEDINGSQFIGVAIVDIASKIAAGQVEIEVIKDKVKQGTLKVELSQNKSKKPDQSEKQINDKNIVKKRNIKTYAVEAVMKQDIKKGGFIKLFIGDQQYETTPIFSQAKQLKWNQSFQIKCAPGQELTAKLCLKEDIQQEIGRCSIQINEVVNKKYELSLLDSNNVELGKLYLQFYDQELDIKEDIHTNKSIKQVKQAVEKKEQKKEQIGKVEAKVQQAPPESKISTELQSKINNKNEQIKKRYANRQSIHDYMAEVNSVLQEGLLMIARERPEDPIKHLGLFLINYKKQ